MKLGKNKKKAWRKCVAGIEEDIIKSNQLKEIEDISFSITGKVEKKELKYSTVPRIRVKKLKNIIQREVVDVWANDDEKPALSKRRAKMMENMIRYKKPTEIIHSGTSWNPQKEDHKQLLEMLESDQMKKITNDEKFVFKSTATLEDKPESELKADDEMEIEETAGEQIVLKKPKALTTKQRRQRLAHAKNELHRQKQKQKEKTEAHELRNISKLRKEIKTMTKNQKIHHEKLLAEKKHREDDKLFRDQIKSLPFQLESELASNLRSMNAEGDLLAELAHKTKGHKFKAEKPKKMKKLTKMVKKNGLV